MIAHRRLVGAFLAFSVALGSAAAHSQTIGDRVRDHVDTELEKKPKPKKKKKKKRRKKKKRERPERRSRPAARQQAPATDPAQQQVDEALANAPRGSDLPIRIIGKQLMIDPQFGFGYRGWRPQGFRTVDVSTGNYFTGRIEVQAKIFGFLKLNRGFYETNAIRAPQRKGAVVAEAAGQAAPKVTVLFGVLGVPLDFNWEPMIAYQARAYEVKATPTENVRVIPHSASENDDLTAFPLSREQLEIVSRVETLVGAVRYKPTKKYSGLVGESYSGWIPPFYLGVGFMSYAKPYQVTVGDATLDELLFDARFRGLGLALGFDIPRVPDNFFVNFETQIGIGQVKLTKDLTLNEALPDDWFIGYSQGAATVGYLQPLARTAPTPLLGISASGGWATFFFFKTQRAEGETFDAPPLNWDAFWAGRVFAVVPL